MSNTYKRIPPDSAAGVTSDSIINVSTVVGSAVTDALNNLLSQIGNSKYTPTPIITLTLTDIINRYILINPPNDPTKTIMLVVSAGQQAYGPDFTYLTGGPGPRISWNSLALDGKLVAGDQIIIISQ